MAGRSCPSCGSTNLTIVGSDTPGWVLVICNNCGNKWEIRVK